METESITDILINGCVSAYVDGKEGLQVLPNPFSTQRAVEDFVERLTIPIGKHLDAAHPFMDGRILDGSRFHLIAPPLAPFGPLISIRKFRGKADTSLDSFGSAFEVKWLREQVREQKTLLIVGGTGSGKTTLLARLLEEASSYERLVVVEESRELRVDHPHVVFLEARAANVEGKGCVTLKTLIRNCLRMRPDRLVVGEVRGDEALEMLLALNTGHRGSLCTLHANSALDGLKRLETLVRFSQKGLAADLVGDLIGRVIDGVVFLERKGHQRLLSEMISVKGREGTQYRILPVESRDGENG